MGGGSSTPPPRIEYRTDPAATAAAQAAAEAAKQAAAQNEAMRKRMEQMESQTAQNQQNMIAALNKMAEASARDNSAEIESLREQQRREVEDINRKRTEMENRMAQQMAAAKEENKAALARQHEAHRAEEERLEQESRANRLIELRKQTNLLLESLAALDQEYARVTEQLGVEEEKLDTIKNFLIIELQARAQFEPPDLNGEAHKLVMLGNTGDGKSTLGNRLTGDESRKGDRGMFAAAGGIESVTQLIKTGFTRYNEEIFCICDTPGGGDTGQKDRIHATNLVDFLHGIGSVTAFVLVRNVTNKRLSDGDQAILGRLQELLGAAFWRNVMIVFTRVDDEDEMEELDDQRCVLPNRLGDVFNLPQEVVSKIEVVGCGKRNFREQAGRIFEAALRCNDGAPFVGTDLVAPVEERQMEHDAQQSVVNELRTKMHELAQRKGNLEAQLEQTRNFSEELSTM